MPDTSAQVPPTSLAARYLTVDMREAPTTRLARVGYRLWAAAYWLLPVLLDWLSDPEPKNPTLVVVARRSDGLALTTFRHDRLVEATEHRDDLNQRLSTLHIFDVCRDLALNINTVGVPAES